MGRIIRMAQVRPLLQQAGHAVFTPSLTGQGERAHLATPEVNLSTHIQDVYNAIWYEDLTRHHPGRPQLRRHGRHGRRRPHARAHQAPRLPRRVPARRRPEPVRPGRPAQSTVQRLARASAPAHRGPGGPVETPSAAPRSQRAHLRRKSQADHAAGGAAVFVDLYCRHRPAGSGPVFDRIAEQSARQCALDRARDQRRPRR